MNRDTVIFEAIRELLEERDVENITIGAVAEKCHMHVNTVKYYFKGKADMMMRFHTYATNVRTSGLPQSYYRVPENIADAVKAVIEIIDLELFRFDYNSKAQRKLYLYLFVNTVSSPQIRDYLVEKKESYKVFLTNALNRYVDAGIINTERFSEALTSIDLLITGYTFSHYYYSSLPPDIHLRHERRRLIFMLVKPEYHDLLHQFFDE